MLLGIGLVVVYSISPGLSASQGISQNYFISKQLINVSLGLAAFAFAAFFPVRRWLALTMPLALVALVASILVLFTPLNEAYQAHRWITIGGFSFQVAELIKLALLLWLARFLTDKWRQNQLSESRLAILVMIGVLVAKFQSDLGSAAVMISMLGLMAYAAGLPLKYLGIIAATIVIFGALAILSSDYRRERVASYLNPGENCQTSGYQACQALISVGSGGVFGQGLGYGVQAYGYLPEASNDSIFAIMAEKFGFVGSSGILLIYGLFLRRLKLIATHSAEPFSRLVVVGLLAWFSTQMIINVGAMVGLLPLKGITLPLISQGGTSIVCLMAALGLTYQISRYTSYSQVVQRAKSENNNYSPDGRRLRRAHNAPVVARPRT
jgi:cell division protein FtsW